ncbi:MAG: agmatinase [Rhizobiales bacterium]|nr:agmatinase [Hyphomicrobiales bacterium]
MADKHNPAWPAPDQAITREQLTGGAFEATFAGVLSFARRSYTRDIAEADVVITGIPLDVGSSYRPGSRFGPQSVRAASALLAENPAFPGGADPFDTLAVADYGDCPFDYGRAPEIAEAISAHASSIIDKGPMLVSIGGDHFITYPLLKAHAAKYGPLALVQFDAHQDTWADDGERLDHGTMITRAVKEGLIDIDRSVQVGIRTTAPETYGIAILDAPEVHAAGDYAIAQRIIDIVGDAVAYLTFDIDCLDPAFAPGTGTPVAGGLSSAQALAILRQLGAIDFVGMDLAEVSPPYDHADITALAGATIVYDFIAQIVAPRRLGVAGS